MHALQNFHIHSPTHTVTLFFPPGSTWLRCLLAKGRIVFGQQQPRACHQLAGGTFSPLGALVEKKTSHLVFGLHAAKCGSSTVGSA